MEIKEKNIIVDSIKCLSNAKLNNISYEVARDVILDYLDTLQEENLKLTNINISLKDLYKETLYLLRKEKEKNGNNV